MAVTFHGLLQMLRQFVHSISLSLLPIHTNQITHFLSATDGGVISSYSSCVTQQCTESGLSSFECCLSMCLSLLSSPVWENCWFWKRHWSVCVPITLKLLALIISFLSFVVPVLKLLARNSSHHSLHHSFVCNSPRRAPITMKLLAFDSSRRAWLDLGEMSLSFAHSVEIFCQCLLASFHCSHRSHSSPIALILLPFLVLLLIESTQLRWPFRRMSLQITLAAAAVVLSLFKVLTTRCLS